MTCIKIEDLMKEYGLSRKEFMVIATHVGLFVTDKDTEVCGVPDFFFDIVRSYVEIKKELEKNDFVVVNKRVADVLAQLGYTVFEFYNEPYVTAKYKVVKHEDTKLVTDPKDRARIIYLGRKTLVPNDLYEKIQQLKKRESQRAETFTIDVT